MPFLANGIPAHARWVWHFWAQASVPQNSLQARKLGDLLIKKTKNVSEA